MWRPCRERLSDCKRYTPNKGADDGHNSFSCMNLSAFADVESMPMEIEIQNIEL
jgi:hypothetical protein